MPDNELEIHLRATGAKEAATDVETVVDAIDAIPHSTTDAAPAIDTVVDAIDAIPDAADKAAPAVETVVDAIDTIPDAADTAAPAVDKVVDAIDTIPDAADTAADILDTLGDTQTDTADTSGLLTTALGFLGGGLTKLGGTAAKLGNILISAVSGPVGAITAAVSALSLVIGTAVSAAREAADTTAKYRGELDDADQSVRTLSTAHTDLSADIAAAATAYDDLVRASDTAYRQTLSSISAERELGQLRRTLAAKQIDYDLLTDKITPQQAAEKRAILAGEDLGAQRDAAQKTFLAESARLAGLVKAADLKAQQAQDQLDTLLANQKSLRERAKLGQSNAIAADAKANELASLGREWADQKIALRNTAKVEWADKELADKLATDLTPKIQSQREEVRRLQTAADTAMADAQISYDTAQTTLKNIQTRLDLLTDINAQDLTNTTTRLDIDQEAKDQAEAARAADTEAKAQAQADAAYQRAHDAISRDALPIAKDIDALIDANGPTARDHDLGRQLTRIAEKLRDGSDGSETASLAQMLDTLLGQYNVSQTNHQHILALQNQLQRLATQYRDLETRQAALRTQ